MTTNENDSSVTGDLRIEDSVLDTIASMAAADVAGVHSLGRSGIAGAIDSVRGGGVSSEHGQREAAFNFDLVVVWGHNIPDVVSAVRSNVAAAIEQMTNLQTVEVNIHVRDIAREEVEEGRKLA